MPHITKWSEKCQLVKPKYDNWSMDLERKYSFPPDFSSNKYSYNARGILSEIIDKIFEEAFPQIQDKFFDQFVDIKEVPYGRHNSDTDYQGS